MSSRAIASRSLACWNASVVRPDHRRTEPHPPRGEETLAPAVRQHAAERQRALVSELRILRGRAETDLLRHAKSKANAEFQTGSFRRLRHRRDQTQRIGIVRHRLLEREAAQIAVAGLLPIRDGFLILARALELLRDHFGRRLDDVRKPLLQDHGDRRVKLLAPRPQHGRIGGVLNQRVLEGIGRIRRRAAQENELCLGQPDQRVLQHRVGQAGDRRQHLIGKNPSDRGADLQDLARRAEAVDA